MHTLPGGTAVAPIYLSKPSPRDGQLDG